MVPGVQAVAVAGPEPSLAVQVNEAIDRGAAHLRKRQGPDGSYLGAHDDHFSLGLTGLVVYALVKSGISPQEPDVARGVAYLTSRKPKTTYDASFVVLGLDASQDASTHPHLKETARWLQRTADEKTGLWAYPTGPTDLSNTQLALLALWAARKRGIETPRAVWKQRLSSLPAFRAKQGGYTYRAPPNAGWPTGSMTTAALTALHLVQRGLVETKGSRTLLKRVDKQAAEAWAWMDRRFGADGNPIGGHLFTRDNHLYYLYGLERAAALGGRSQIGGRNWYREGARYLVGAQQKDGSWGETADTCFALLFLRRATFTSLGLKPAEPTEDEPGAARAADPTKPPSEVSPIGRWLVLDSLLSPGEADAPAVPCDETTLRPVEGRRCAGLTWTKTGYAGRRITLPWSGGGAAHRLSYVGTWLHVSEDGDAVLWLEQSGGAVVYVGGRKVHERRVVGGDGVPTPVRIRLSQGVHALVIRVETWEQPCHIGLKVASPTGRAAPHVRWSLSPDSPDTLADLESRPSVVQWGEMLVALPSDEEAALDFSRAPDVGRVRVLAGTRAWTTWVETRPGRLARHPVLSRGLLQARLAAGSTYATLVRKIAAPEHGAVVAARLAVIRPAGPQGSRPYRVRLGIFDGTAQVLQTESLGPVRAGARDPWLTITGRMPETRAEHVLLFLAVQPDEGTIGEAHRLYVDEFSARDVR